jgi:hypothetical protein
MPYPMKIPESLLLSLLLTAAASAQTNTFPASGNVGIGTTSPGAALDVTGSAIFGSTTSRPIVLWENYGSISIQGNSGGWAFGLHAKGYLGTWRAGFGFLGAGDDLQYAYVGDSYANPTMVIYPDNGNVGIGTTSPGAKLDIFEDGQHLTFLTNKKLSGSWPASDEATTMTIQSSGNQAGNLAFATGNDERVRITASGNVGIGTTNPTQKLSVNGSVRAKEVIVDSGWSDFVFDESYKLKALSETEAFIKTKKHLPGIPSSQDVAEHGISVGEMQAKLLAKIEELMLHQIEQEKQLVAQQKEIERLHSLVSKYPAAIR